MPGVLVTFPSGETRRLLPGPSSSIARAVVEEFANRFFRKAAVLLLSESDNKIVARDDGLARRVGLNIDAARTLPDIILVDVGRTDLLLVFVEVVATDGPINERRKKDLEEIAASAGFAAEHLAFVTAYADRGAVPFKKTVGSLAWGSYAWFASEPAGLMELTERRSKL